MTTARAARVVSTRLNAMYDRWVNAPFTAMAAAPHDYAGIGLALLCTFDGSDTSLWASPGGPIPTIDPTAIARLIDALETENGVESQEAVLLDLLEATRLLVETANRIGAIQVAAMTTSPTRLPLDADQRIQAILTAEELAQ